MKKLAFKRRFLIFSALLSFFCLFGVVSCNYGFFWGLFGEENVDDRSSSLRSLQTSVPNFSVQSPALSTGVYSALIITDMHYGATWGNDNEQDFLDWLSARFESGDAEKIPRFIVNLGDTADGGHRSEFKDYVDFENRIKSLAKDKLGDSDYKIYSILGNHDLYNNGVEGYEDLCYPYISSYYFSISVSGSGFTFYFLDTANGTLGESQLNDFKDKISSDSRPKIVFTHYPIYAGAGESDALLMRLQNTMERNTLLTYFSKYNIKQVFEGHIHKRTSFDFKKFREDVINSFRYGEAALFTVNEQAGTVSTEIITF